MSSSFDSDFRVYAGSPTHCTHNVKQTCMSSFAVNLPQKVFVKASCLPIGFADNASQLRLQSRDFVNCQCLLDRSSLSVAGSRQTRICSRLVLVRTSSECCRVRTPFEDQPLHGPASLGHLTTGVSVSNDLNYVGLLLLRASVLVPHSPWLCMQPYGHISCENTVETEINSRSRPLFGGKTSFLFVLV